MVLQQLAELGVLLLRGQGAEQQQPDDLLKHEAVMGVGLGGQRVNVDAAVDQAAPEWGTMVRPSFLSIAD